MYFCVGEEKRRRKRSKIFGEGNILKEVTNSREGKGGIIWRGKINVDAD